MKTPLRAYEDQLTLRVEGLLAQHPIYTEFLYNVKGIGPRLSGSLIAQTMIRFEKCSEEQLANYSEEQRSLAMKTENSDYRVPILRGIEAFPTVSKYWAWCGLDVREGHAPKRKYGESIDWNPKMRTLAWKIGKQFVIQGERYRMLYDVEKLRLTATRLPVGFCPHYDECKAKLKNRSEPACKGHIDAMARRKTVKLFLSHVWEKWRELEGLPVRQPYALEYLGHVTKEAPMA
jgi:hypothetical protein